MDTTYPSAAGRGGGLCCDADELHIPDIDPDDDVLTAAITYAAAGWYVLPVRRGTKNPGSRVGKGWHTQSSRDIEQITAWFAGTDDGIALHVGRSGALVFDVDAPDYLTDELTAHLDGAPYQSTRPVTPGRGHYVYRQPLGRTIGNSTGGLGNGWGEVRGLNGVIIVAPSVHPDEDGEYQWERTGTVPVLPSALAEKLTDGSSAEDAATDTQVTEFLAAHTRSERPDILAGFVKHCAERIAAGESRHGTLTAVLAGAMKEARAGFYPAQLATDTLRELFVTAAMKDPISSKQKPARTSRQAHAEFNGMLAWAIGQARAADIDAIRQRVAEKMPEADLDVLSVSLDPPTADLGRDTGNGQDGGDPKMPGQARFTDAGLAEIAAEKVLRGKFIRARGIGWHRWTSTHWQECGDGPPTEAIRRFVMGRIRFFAKKLAADPANNDYDEAIKSWKPVASRNRITSVLALAGNMVENEPDCLDADPDLLNTPGGIVDLRTGALTPHDPAKLMTKITKGSYRLNDGGTPYTHPDVEQALTALPDDERAWFQRRIGQAITGRPTPDGVVPVLQGGGENGKSALTTGGLVPALGGYATMASAKLFAATEKGSEHSTEVADLRGRRLVVGEELTEGRSLNMTVLKRIMDTPRIKARYIRQDNIEFAATHSLFITTNHRPVIAETDHGTWRRLALVIFPYTYRKTDDDVVLDTDRRGDPLLKQRIADGDDGQHDALVTWAVQGAVACYADPSTALLPTEKIAADTRDWRAETDRVLGYWCERLIPDDGTVILVEDLLTDFNDWLSSGGHHPWPVETFTARFANHTETQGNRVEKRRIRNPRKVSHRYGGDTAITGQARVWAGMRFRRAEDEMAANAKKIDPLATDIA
ncbi:phage/plasmid primase, P4 family [Mycolicibacillus koreensis]|uniref:Uncharacterized protein n=1 Tax=Mycolicibacillus koreensis TaxID=1069220 RepID=A0A7I7SCE8_9MYCO|nr:phage/plasmid primase, P4 family [Mycolicibacillus koreensis]OSC34129.1 hypothetical protein B8W67_08220 [Mycolicibacillus koreensis]BBY54594.1 hypothetical protein MKOR_18450 [Mycolicibacillus koreensis]